MFLVIELSDVNDRDEVHIRNSLKALFLMASMKGYNNKITWVTSQELGSFPFRSRKIPQRASFYISNDNARGLS